MPTDARTPWLTRIRSGLGNGWPNHCAACRASTRGPAARVCRDCLERFAPVVPRCGRCALQLPQGVAVCGACLRAPPPWSGAVAACDYRYPWDGLLSALKFRDALDLAAPLAQRLAQALQACPTPPVDVLLPVPLAAARLRERGYNQAALLAAQLARRRAVRVEPGWLLRLADTPRQTALPRDRRVANMRGAFAVEPLALPVLRDRHVALVDDVMTTGATAGEITRVLLAGGAASVQVWVVARTPP
ncbi:ComF family protein [Methylibium sp.]|uniref:ComF family protein n=1 Tax=Methylibium sp. TaxID=2067992 RepID=UPI003D0A1715